MCFSIKSGLIAGRHHIVYGINCQDSYETKAFEHHENTYYIGVVTDGCGEGERSETGSHLATSFLIHKLEELVRKNYSEDEIPQRLFDDLLEFLKSLLNNLFTTDTPPQEIVNFIKNHLLFTVLGFFVTPKETVIFAIGDGIVLLNDFIDIRNENNHPSYIAYHLVDDQYLSENRTPLPKEFDLYKVSTKSLNKLAVGTDAWESELGILLSLWDEQTCKNVQRTMNVLSKKEKRFKDDAAIITITKEEVVNEGKSSKQNS